MKLSIVTIAFNSENEIEETLKSCISIKDKFPSTEYIIIDGKSTDRTLDIISKYQINIDKILSESDDGIYDAFNKGMDLSIGEYIIFMNSGDTFHDQFDISNFFSNINIEDEVIYCNTLIKFGNGKLMLKKFGNKNLNFIVGLPFCHQSVFVKKNIYKKHQFQTKYKIFSTVDYFYNLFINKVKFKYYDYLVSNYDYTGVSSNFNYNSVKELTKIHKNNQNINIYIYMILYYTLLKSYIKKVIN